MFITETVAWATIRAVRAARTPLETLLMFINAVLDTFIVISIALFDTVANLRIADLFALKNY